MPHVMPSIKYLTTLCHQRWESDIALASIERTPILFLSGKNDELVPPSHMKDLYDIAKASNLTVSWSDFEHGTHNDTCIQPGYFESIMEFIKSL